MLPEWRAPGATVRPRDILEALPEHLQQQLATALDQCFVDLCKEQQGGGVTAGMVVMRFISSHREFWMCCSSCMGAHILTLFLISALDSAAASGCVDRLPASTTSIQ